MSPTRSRRWILGLGIIAAALGIAIAWHYDELARAFGRQPPSPRPIELAVPEDSDVVLLLDGAAVGFDRQTREGGAASAAAPGQPPYLFFGAAGDSPGIGRIDLG
jgi:hypothetical protein